MNAAISNAFDTSSWAFVVPFLAPDPVRGGDDRPDRASELDHAAMLTENRARPPSGEAA
jgi:hypothetical protein